MRPPRRRSLYSRSKPTPTAGAIALTPVQARQAAPITTALLLLRAARVSKRLPITQEMPRKGDTLMTKTLLLSTLVLACAALLPAQQSPAETGIRKAQEEIAKHRGHYPYYNGLAMAYARRARETSDVAYYGKAEEALKKSFEISPDNFEGRKLRTWLLLGRHEFAAAREVATRLNQQNPDDVTVYGYLVDA